MLCVTLAGIPLKFAISQRCERLVFADTNDGKVKRMLILQFEGFLPHVEGGQYRYDFTGRPVVADILFVVTPMRLICRCRVPKTLGMSRPLRRSFWRGKG